ncbi:MAG: DUF1566 domain-containing protein [Treponema sp.]|nr:DUF1566 domain-containing protein [Treponema sp.]
MKTKTLGCLAAALCLAMIFPALGCSTFNNLKRDLASVSSSSSSGKKSNGTKTTTTTVSDDGKTVTTTIVEDMYRRKDTGEPRYMTYFSPGNIVYSDGTMTDEFSFDKSKTPVAIIFDAKNRLGVALTMTSLAWADEKSAGYKMNFKTSGTSGAENWNVIKAADSAGTKTNAQKNYPAFNYCANYSTPGYKSGWYLPSSAELKTLMYYKYNVENALKRIPGAKMINPGASKNAMDSYWSSTQWVFTGNANLANDYRAAATYNTNLSVSGTIKSTSNYVRPIRKF